MKAVIFNGPGDVVLKKKNKPVPREGWATVKVIQTGICGGDIHFYDGTMPYVNYPQIYGHEFVGTITEINGGSDLNTGDRVVSEILLPCGTCYPCRHGKINCCTKLQIVGVHTPGAFAEYVTVPIKNLHKVPEGLSNDDAVLVEPYGIGHHAIERSGIKPGEKALIVGAGTIGLTILDILKANGIETFIADLSPFKLEKARTIGADHIIDSSSTSLTECIMNMTDGEGVGYVFDATGSAKMMGKTEEYVAAGGTIVLVGLTNDQVQFTGLNFTKREMNVLGTRNSVNSFEPVLQLMDQGKLHQKEFITYKFSIDDAAEGFRKAHDTQANQIKSVIFMERSIENE